jgi:hypothetical protein
MVPARQTKLLVTIKFRTLSRDSCTPREDRQRRARFQHQLAGSSSYARGLLEESMRADGDGEWEREEEDDGGESSLQLARDPGGE